MNNKGRLKRLVIFNSLRSMDITDPILPSTSNIDKKKFQSLLEVKHGKLPKEDGFI